MNSHSRLLTENQRHQLRIDAARAQYLASGGRIAIIPTGQSGEQPKPPGISPAKKTYEISDDILRSYIEQGLSHKQIAQKIGCSRPLITRKIQQLLERSA